jgi:hypothetical protein
MLHLALSAVLSLFSAGDVHGGAIIGLQSSDLVGDDAKDRAGYPYLVGNSSPRTGIGIGGYAEVESGSLGARASLLLSQKGWSRDWPSADPVDHWTQRLTYLELPLEVKILSGGPKTAVRAYLLGGLYWAGLLSAYRSADDSDNRSDWYSSAAGFSLGLGAQGAVAPGRIGFQVRVRQDLTSICGPRIHRELDVHNMTIGADLLVGI